MKTLTKERFSIPAKGNGCDALEIYKKWNFKIGETSDSLFLEAEMPEGWKTECTSHGMWNNILDQEGRVRAMYFYKSAFYDRDAFVNDAYTFYTIEKAYPDNAKSEETYSVENIEMRGARFLVKDGEGKLVFDTGIHKYMQEYKEEDHYEWWDNKDVFFDKIRNLAVLWLNENFPQWEDELAYW